MKLQRCISISPDVQLDYNPDMDQLIRLGEIPRQEISPLISRQYEVTPEFHQNFNDFINVNSTNKVKFLIDWLLNGIFTTLGQTVMGVSSW